MRKFTNLINESIESMTWGELTAQDDVDFIGLRPVDLLRRTDKIISSSQRTQLTNNISIYDANDFILVCKNDDPLAIMHVYEMHGFDNFKNIVVVYGHEEILFFDCDDFTHKKIYTR